MLWRLPGRWKIRGSRFLYRFYICKRTVKKNSHVHGADSRINVCGLTISLHINVSKDENVETVEKKCDHWLHTSNQWYAFETYLTNIFRTGADILNRFKSRYKLKHGSNWKNEVKIILFTGACSQEKNTILVSMRSYFFFGIKPICWKRLNTDI